MGALRDFTRGWLRDPAHGDTTLAEILDSDETDAEDAFSIILNNTVCRALAYFDFALQTGEAELVEDARELLSVGLRVAGDAGKRAKAGGLGGLELPTKRLLAPG
jgi:hypothetical protein